jgi:arylsulfatase A-like enzyme
LGAYGDFVMETDHVMGEIRKALQKTKQEDNTLIIFTSDNGCSKAAGISDLAQKGHKVSAHLRGSKADLWDGGHRIPFIVKWPGKVKEGSQSDQLICLTDLYASVADILKMSPPKKSCEDSVSFLPALFGENIISSRKGVIHHSISGHFAYRMGKWKLLLAKASGGWSSPKENQVKTDAPPAQLYDMSKDSEEQKNLYAEKSPIVKKLLSHLKEDIVKGRSTEGSQSSNDVGGIVIWKSEKKRSRK